jgi:hypothetical protein
MSPLDLAQALFPDDEYKPKRRATTAGKRPEPISVGCHGASLIVAGQEFPSWATDLFYKRYGCKNEYSTGRDTGELPSCKDGGASCLA